MNNVNKWVNIDRKRERERENIFNSKKYGSKTNIEKFEIFIIGKIYCVKNGFIQFISSMI